MTTTAIPLTTLPVGSQAFGPAIAADSETQITLTVDRTVTGGLNSLTPASTISVDIQQSDDGGITWQDLGAFTAIGGSQTYTDRNNVVHVYTVSAGSWTLFPGASRQLKAAITVAGTSIAVAGSIVTQ